MSGSAQFDPSVYEWQPRSLFFPRIGKLLNRDGLSTRLLMPGDYMVRRSRTYDRWIYRYRHD
ncbi:MAG: hypothetical protein C0520_09180 [Sphingopyxis sp.]|nr:hypothetical protein [Sphingopyxis sp.]